MNKTALLAQNALTAQQTFATAALQELVTAVEERDATIAKLSELVKTQAAELETLRPKETP